MDSPISCWNDDKFEICKYSNALFTFIKETDTPTVLSVEWGWWEWKTSLLNLIDSKLDSEKDNFLHIRFDAWKFIFSDDMNKAFLSLVLSKVFQNKSLLKKITKINIGPMVKFVWKAWLSFLTWTDINFDELWWQSNWEDIRESFEDVIKKLQEEKWLDYKIVISLDDLDRIPPVKAIEIIEIIKNFLDVPWVVFLLVVDKDIIKKWLSEKFNLDGIDEGKKEDFFDLYFDKVIQLSFRVPKKDSEEFLGDYISSILWDKISREDINKSFINIIKSEKYFDSNPRSIKRIANIYSLKKIIFDSEKQNAPEKDIFNWLFLSAMLSSNKRLREDYDDWALDKELKFAKTKIFEDIEETTNIVSWSNWRETRAVEMSKDKVKDYLLNVTLKWREEHFTKIENIIDFLLDNNLYFQERTNGKSLLVKKSEKWKQFINIEYFSTARRININFMARGSTIPVVEDFENKYSLGTLENGYGNPWWKTIQIFFEEDKLVAWWVLITNNWIINDIIEVLQSAIEYQKKGA